MSKRGVDGVDGVSVTDAKIDFDGSLVITLSDGREINVGEVVPVDVAEKIRTVHNIQSGSGGDSQTVLDAIAALQATIATYGTMATQNANNVAITGGTINNTTIGATTPSTGVFTTLTSNSTSEFGKGSAQYIRAVGDATAPVLSAQGSGTNIDFNVTTKGTGSFKINNVGGTIAEFNDGGSGTPVNSFLFAAGAASGTRALIRAMGGPITLLSTGSNSVNFATNGSSGNIQAAVSHTASAVNYVQVTGAATGGHPTISSQGSDSNARLILNAKGSSSGIDLLMNSARQMFIGTNGSAVNYFQTGGTASGIGLSLQAQGSDTNISQVFQSKGTGAIDLAAGSSGVNISNGGTVTAITRTATGSAYTSAPTVAISAPTTAGGVQATATCTIRPDAVTIVSGGTGYTLNDTLTASGGTFTTTFTLTVTGVSGGVITSVSIANFGAYSVAPSNAVSVTGGTGSGATFNVTNWGINSTFTITAAGSGYVEQPTVTFSGGGGSGAAAYARVGGVVSLNSLGSTLNLGTEAGTGFRVLTAGATATDMWQAISNGTTAILRSSSATSNAQVQTGGTGSLSLGTNGGFTQLNVAHTASSVNYVQVTGAATGGGPIISAQGSDADVRLNLSSKGTNSIDILTNSSSQRQFRFLHTASALNYFQATGGATGFGPVLSAQGSDTNIPAVVQPKGTGALQAQQTDSTATGGNARGANAVDWQTQRLSASQVASAPNTVVIGGGWNTASGILSSVVGGFNNSATGYGASIVGGVSNNAAGYYNFVGNGSVNSGTSGSAVTTQSGTMNGTTAVTLSGSNASIKVGQFITGTSIAANTYVAAISGTSLTLSQAASGSSTSTLSFYTPHGVVVGGGNNTATGSYSFIGGGGDAGTAANRNVASGDWSVVVGGATNTASGIGSVICGGGTNGSGNFANGASGTASSILGGLGHTASGTGSSVLGGYNNVSNGSRSTVLSGRYGTTRSINGNVSIPACDSPIAQASGVSQTGILVLARQTTDATATVLASDANAASTTNQVILPNNSAYAFRGTVIANVTGGGNTKAWAIEGAIKRGANAASTALVGTPTVTSSYADAGASTWDITATADTTNGGLAITFTGQAATTIRCVAKLETTEVTF